ncbi:MAG: ATP-binding protein [Bacteroidetes bacterium]|nr:ATP-binding protein [Bacteroidota bacterium]MBU1719153.1 ATP-binding protein [Bacteroidota bacterium]
MSTDQIKRILLDQHKGILKKDPGIQRRILSGIEEKIHLPFVHVITGMRRCGKSTLLRQIMLKCFKEEDYYYINFEDERFLGFQAKDFNLIYEALLELFGKRTVFFIDEIQNIVGFQHFVRRFSDDGNKFFITGSNSQLLSSEIGSKLTGRHIDTLLYPFSFVEFLAFQGKDFSQNDLLITESRAIIKSLFSEYFLSGGMPEYVKYRDKEILTRIYDDIVVKDIVARFHIENQTPVRELYRFLASNIGQQYSYNSLRKAVGIGATITVQKYLDHLEQTFFAKQVPKFAYSLKKQIQNEKKMFLTDHGFFTVLSMNFSDNKGWIFENLVFSDLSRNNDIYYFHEKNECDFVAVGKEKKSYAVFQATWEITDQNRKREISGIEQAMDFLGLNSGTILTMDQEEQIAAGNKVIQVVPFWKHCCGSLKS